MNERTLQPDAIRAELEKVVSSAAFQGAGRSGKLLRFLVERTVNGLGDQLKEFTLGVEALGRGATFDPRTDSIVRVEASRLRSRLDVYYASEGRLDPVRIVLPKGGYAPRFEWASADAAPVASADRTWIWKLSTACALAIALLAVWRPWNRTVASQATATRLEVDLGAGVSLRSAQVGSSSVILAPDGRRLVFVSFRKDGVPRLMTLMLDQLGGSEPVELPGAEGARGPFFSWDGRWVGFLAAGKLWKTQVEGGTPVPLCDTPELLGASWGDDNTIIAALTTTGLWRIPSSGGKPTLIERVPDGALWPQVLPGSRAVLFSAGAASPRSRSIAVLSLTDHKVKTLIQGASYARYLPSGHLAFVDRGTLNVIQFNPGRLEVSGNRTSVMTDIAQSLYGAADFDVARTGQLICRRKAGGAQSVIRWLGDSGPEGWLMNEPAEYSWPRLSPDGTHLAFVRANGEQQSLRIYACGTGKLIQETSGREPVASPVWTPDGRFVAVSGSTGGMSWVSAEGGALRTLTTSTDQQIPWSFHPSGSRLAFYQRSLKPGGSATFNLWTVPIKMDGGVMAAGNPEPFLVSNAFEVYPEFSPDGRWVAYTSLESGAYEVYVRAFPDNGRKWQVSIGGGVIAHWAKSGQRLFYRTNDQHLMVENYTTTGGVFQSQPPHLLVDAQLAETGVLPNFDVGPTGKIAGLFSPNQAGQQHDHHVTFVMDFLAEVRRRAGL
jgi:eukaryotic-like serine/threonine-protein kinase